MAEQVFLAVDLGASGGRVLAGRCDGKTLQLEEVHRFDNGPVQLGRGMYWDLPRLWSSVCDGLRAASARYGKSVRSIGVDTWGVDFGLLGRNDELLGNPRHYRDPHTNGILDAAFEIVPRADIFAESGLQFMQFNTLYQLLALKRAKSSLLDVAQSLLMIPDLFHWLLTGEKANEVTNATTTQFFNPLTHDWSRTLLDRFGLPTNILGKLVEPGTTLGTVKSDVAHETGMAGVSVVLPGTHDTASAVMAVPAASVNTQKPDWCYISSGTWSLMGVESPTPVVSPDCLRLNFTNEGGIGGTTRLLKNITGLWIVQECRRIWQQQGKSLSWDALTQMAASAPTRASFVNPDNASFVAPADMPAAIRDYCRRTGQTVPESEGAVIRTAIESLALRSRQVLSWLEEPIGGKIETIHIVGGGTQNKSLCQATADACGRRVLAGPIEATATGNVLVQAMAAGVIGSVAEARDLVRRSFTVDEYQPRETSAWNEAYERFLAVTRDT